MTKLTYVNKDMVARWPRQSQGEFCPSSNRYAAAPAVAEVMVRNKAWLMAR